jgi:ankyrin repeat protein
MMWTRHQKAAVLVLTAGATTYLLVRAIARARRPPSGEELCMACKSGDVQRLASLLLIKHCNPNAKNEGSWFPLMWSAKADQPECAALLLAHRLIDVNETNKDGATSLYVAAQSGCLAIVEQLLAHPAIEVRAPPPQAAQPRAPPPSPPAAAPRLSQVNKWKVTGGTPFFAASEKGHAEVIARLLERPEIMVNKGADTGTTPLSIACQKCQPDVVKLLLARPEIEVNAAHLGSMATALYLTAKVSSVVATRGR